MNKFYFLFYVSLFIAGFTGCGESGSEQFSSFAQAYKIAGATAGAKDSSTIRWETSFKDIGVAKKGADIDIKFPFENTGSSPLIIDSAFVSCGCTLISIPQTPVQPGRKSYIVARYVTREQPAGAFLIRNIYLRANTQGSPYHTLGFKVQLTE